MKQLLTLWLSWLCLAAATVPAITTQPASQAVTLGAKAKFAVVASGTAPFAYQWSKNGTVISGAASASYRMLYYAKTVELRPAIRTETVLDKWGNSWEIERPITELFVPDGQGGREWNDTVVAISSAIYDGGTLFCPVFVSNLGGIMLKNHSSVKSAELADGIVEQIRVDWPLSSH